MPEPLTGSFAMGKIFGKSFPKGKRRKPNRRSAKKCYFITRRIKPCKREPVRLPLHISQKQQPLQRDKLLYLSFLDNLK